MALLSNLIVAFTFFCFSVNSEVLSDVVQLQARDLPLQKITLFRSRAEIKRRISTDLKNGLTKVVVRNVAPTVDSESIRVSGTGDAIIEEVQFKTEYASSSQIDTPKIKELVKELKEVESNRNVLKDEKDAYDKRLESLNTMLSKLGENVVSSGGEFGEQKQQIDDVFKYHFDKTKEVRTKIRSVEDKVKEYDEQSETLKREIEEGRRNNTNERSIVILLEADNATKASIDLIYQVTDSYWTPAYDARYEREEEKDRARLALTYFGTIRQTSGEDWNNADIYLSTANSQGQITLPPKLGTLMARIEDRRQIIQPQYARGFSGGFAMRANAPVAEEAEMEDAMVSTPAPAPAPMAAALAMPSTESEEEGLTRTFHIKSRKTIPTGSDDHKVTIVELSFDSIFHLEAVPSKNTNAYIVATAINNSTFPLLAGEVSVYVDNAFSTKTHFNGATIGEKFDCPVGIDDTVKILYKSHKYREQQSDNGSLTTSEQKIHVKNTHKNESILLTIHENIPKSTDNRIKIKLLSPEMTVSSNETSASATDKNEKSAELEIPTPGARIDRDINLEWTVELDSNEEKNFVVKWQAQITGNKTAYYSEEF